MRTPIGETLAATIEDAVRSASRSCVRCNAAIFFARHELAGGRRTVRVALDAAPVPGGDYFICAWNVGGDPSRFEVADAEGAERDDLLFDQHHCKARST